MGFLGRIFSAGTTVDKIRKAYSRQDWAEVLALADSIDSVDSDSDRQQIDEMVTASGNQLARINLEQAEACLRANEYDRAREHLDLVMAHGSSEDLCRQARQLFDQADQPSAATTRPAQKDCTSCESGAAGTADDTAISANEVTADFDEAWELTLAALPDHWSASYARLSPPVQQAILQAHSGQDESAKQVLLGLDDAELCDVTRYELAALHLRSGELAAGLELLERLLLANPAHDLALLLAVDLVRQNVSLPWLQPRLLLNLEQGIHPGPSHAGLAKLASAHDDQESLVQHTKSAIDHGYVDYDLLVWSAQILEKNNQVEAAEQMLLLLPGGGGCSGAADPLLGEFWLRHGRQPDQALNSFKSAARHDPENPRWALRIAQTYLLKGWRKEAGAMLTQILRTPQLDERLQQEAEFSLRQSGS